MTSMFKRRPSASLIISCLALFIALGGTVYAGTAINGKSIKKNSLPGNRVKKKSLPANRLKNGSITGSQIKAGSITGTQINVGTLGKVPSAANADNAANASHANNADNATNAANVGSVRTFSADAIQGDLVSLVKTDTFELVGFCDPAGTTFPPGIQGSEKEREESAFVIYNRSSSPAFAESDDADNYHLDLNEGIGFNYEDNGDGGMAMSTNGHFMALSPYANLVATTNYEGEPEVGDDSPFSSDCHFAGAALVG